MAMAVLSHRWGCYRAVGGMGAVSSALAAFAIDHGGEVRTGSPVARILVDEDGARGVELEGGVEIGAEEVVGAVDPATMFSKLVDPALLPESVRDELRGMTIGESNITYFTGHAALSARPSLPRHGRDQEILRAGYQMLVPSYDALRASIESARRGEIPEQIPIWLSYPSVCDRTLVPEGSDGETLYFMTPVTPYDLAGDREWADAKGVFMSRVLDTVEGYTAGVKRSLIDSAGVSPHEMSRWTTKGHACHVDMTLAQMGPWRPTPSLAGHMTPIEALWQVSAGSSLPSVNGWGGRATARSMLSRRQRRKLSRKLPRGGSDAARPPSPDEHPDRPLSTSVR
jgi:beta-carotene ketolase (CrtO type)